MKPFNPMPTVMKRRLWIFVGILCVMLGAFGILKLNKDLMLWWNCNSIQVTADEPLSVDKIKIGVGNGAAHFMSETDQYIVDHRSELRTIFDGEPMAEIPNEYGENDFLVTYDDRMYLAFRHYKFNRRHQHDYRFHFYMQGHQIYMQADFQGQDAIKFEGPMQKIEDAGQMHGSVPIQKDR